jgi:hypothetical protein
MNTRLTPAIQASFVLALSIGLCCLLAGCWSSPSAGDGERAVQECIKRDSEGCIKLTKFQKTNGAHRELGGFGGLKGLKTYAMEFDAEIEFTENCTWMTGIMGSQLSFNTAPDNFMAGTPVTKGQRVQLAGVVGFVKTENSWSVSGVDLSRMISADESSRRHLGAGISAGSGQSHTTPTASSACVSHLKQIGLTFRIWANDNNQDEQFPFNISTNSGGTKELCRQGNDGFDTNAPMHFQIMSNELKDPKILVCPSDSTRHPAADFQGLRAANVTYQVRSGANLNGANLDEMLARCPIHGHVLYCNGAVKLMDKKQ